MSCTLTPSERSHLSLKNSSLRMTFRKLRASSARPHHIRGVVILHKPRLEHKSCQSQLRADSRVSPNACQGYPPDPARTSAEPECLEVKTFVNDTALFYPSNLRSASFSFFFSSWVVRALMPSRSPWHHFNRTEDRRDMFRSKVRRS